jgi:glycosidase
MIDGFFDEDPAKWTGNGARSPQPSEFDWYETAKLNFGVRPDGSYDFPTLPEGFQHENYIVHDAFWKNKHVPDTWMKFRDICRFWLDKGVDGFRYDMAQMVPVEFWSYLNSGIKMAHPQTILISEIYVPGMYRDYIHLGKMDYLYDKVDLYDTLKHIVQGHGSTDNIIPILEGQRDIEHHMLHFLENHDEQRIASAEFAGDARKGLPAMVLSATVSSAPTMVYFAQELGEAGDGNAGFGSETRTTIYDYWGIPSLIRWNNQGAFDGGALHPEEKELRDDYRKLLRFTLGSEALMGEYREIHSYNRNHTEWYNDRVYSFARWKGEEKLLIISNFDAQDSFGFELALPQELIGEWKLEPGTYELEDQLGSFSGSLEVGADGARTRIDIRPLESLILRLAR